MAEPSNRKTSDVIASSQNCCSPNNTQDEYSQGCSVSSIADRGPKMQAFEAGPWRELSEMAKQYHEANSPDQFEEAYETNAQSHTSPCQHSPWGCVRCSSLPLLNSPFQPNEDSYDNQISYSIDKIEMRRNESPIGQLVFPRQYTRPLLSPSGNQSSSISQYSSMRNLEQQSALFRPAVTPTLSHQSTPQSIFSAPHASPNAVQFPYDWGTPATTVSSSFKGADVNHASPKGHREMYEVPDKDVKIASVLDAHFVLDGGHDNQQWLQDAELDDLNYRRDSQSASVQLHDEKRTFGRETAAAVDFIVPADSRMIGNEKQLPNDEYMQPTYINPEPVMGQQYLSFEPKAFNTMGLAFNNPFASNNSVNPYDIDPTYDHVDPYDAFDFNNPLYQSTTYPLPPATIPSNDLAKESRGKQTNRVGPSRSRHNGRDEGMDRKLVEWRDSGMSYKEIMAKGNFGLEESTLRGRYRTLTKSKEKRLRKPVWDDHAISALLEAVEHHAPSGSKGLYAKESLDKIPWKKVAEWMEKERKCYLYGNATVKKKYVEVIKARRLSRRQTTV